MFLTFLFLIIITIIGYKISFLFLKNRVKKIEFLPISLIVGLTLTSYFILILALIFKNLEIAVFACLFFGGLYCLFLLYQYLTKFKTKIVFSKNYCFKLILNAYKKIPWKELIFLILIILLFLDLVGKTLVFNEGSYRVAAAGYGDIPFHMAQVSYFIHQQPFELENTIYSGHKLSYPFLINLLSSSFYFLNHNYVFSFHLPSFTLLLAGMILFYLLISKFIKKVLVRISTFLIFFLGSGLGFLKIIKDNSIWTKNSIREIMDYILHLPYSMGPFYEAVYPSQNIVWTNIQTMFLLHQRSFFFGFALGILCLFVIYLVYRYQEKKIFYFAGILIGLLPLVHTHTFIALCLTVLGFLAVAIIKKQKLLIIGFLKLLSLSSILAFFTIFFLHFKQKIGNDFLVFRLGWMTERNAIGAVQYNPAWKIHILEWLSFIWQNFGLFLPLLIAAILYLILKRSTWNQKENLTLPLIFGALFIWFTANIIKFQPWDYDNNKILAYFLLLGSLIIGYFFERWRFKGAKILIATLTFFIIFSGTIDVLSRSSFASPTLHEIFNTKEQTTAKWISENILPKQTILTGTSHLNLVSSLSGKPVLMGYPGWLWTHGIKYQEREKDIKKMFEGGEEAEKLFKKYNIDYLMISWKERSNYTVNETFFNQNYPVIFQLDDIKIYKITND